MFSSIMHVEVSVALNFVISYLYNKLPRRRVDGFGEELEKGLKKKFDGHWYPDKPFKGSAFRCIRVSGEEMDPVMEWSANKAGLNIDEVREYLPKDLTIWIDPNEVSYRIGEKGMVKVLYSEKRPDVPEETSAMDKEVQNANRGFNPEAQSFRPIDSLSSSLTNLSVSPPNGWGSSNSPPSATPLASSTSPVAAFINRPSQKTTFTAAAFAATKFGSTKLKSQAKRPSRLSPTEFSVFGKQRPTFQLPSPVGQHNMISNGTYFGNNGNAVLGVGSTLSSPIQAPHSRSMSPRDVRNDYIDQQHRLLVLQQQAFSQQQLSQHQQQSPVHHHQTNMIFGDMLSPAASSLSDLYHSAPQSTAVSPSTDVNLDVLQSSLGNGSMPNLQATPSPLEPSKTFADSLNWNTLPPYVNLQHLLVAN